MMVPFYDTSDELTLTTPTWRKAFYACIRRKLLYNYKKINKNQGFCKVLFYYQAEILNKE